MAQRAERRPRSSPRPRGRRDRSRQAVWAARLVVLAAVFGVGVIVGQALEGPEAGGTQTLVRTLVPTTVGPAERTVTVTTP
jgi:hypothetical protein